ncbi:hypothetical protein ABZ816_29595 [Actinosynnema sp. NPDC047251]|uniref:Uncharacterized protein n=1 Tax=Saccharothrix espanaensis (strain ATCC 51144 / DSM 44229 / JCM 9112 / NBRC 15066 / NRRL 15764) TaxID=1179773 RepID=K0K8R4_SACES|nr:hypothetical protein [Saccharothrix espanaensis]CCH34766.1 hypothetical protein BN6_75410 [Saccharothrix espanaensis DSM 44229]
MGDVRQRGGPRITLRVPVADAGRQAALLAAARPEQRTDVGGAAAYVDDEDVLFWQVSPEPVLSVVPDDVSDPLGVARRAEQSPAALDHVRFDPGPRFDWAS